MYETVTLDNVTVQQPSPNALSTLQEVMRQNAKLLHINATIAESLVNPPLLFTSRATDDEIAEGMTCCLPEGITALTPEQWRHVVKVRKRFGRMLDQDETAAALADLESRGDQPTSSAAPKPSTNRLGGYPHASIRVVTPISEGMIGLGFDDDRGIYRVSLAIADAQWLIKELASRIDQDTRSH